MSLTKVTFMDIASETIDSNWKEKYKTLKEFYSKEYDPNYFTFSRYELKIDPLETFDEIEAYDEMKQQSEMIKCALSFPYFCHKYVKIKHPERGLIPLVLYNYQRRCVDEFENNQFNLLLKFRCGGFSTFTVLWCMWRCMFNPNESIMILSILDRGALHNSDYVKFAISQLPNWMRPEMTKNNDHQKLFKNGSKLFFYTPRSACGHSLTHLILDEAAFIPEMDLHWKSLFPTLSNGGKCICMSTSNGVDNWYFRTFQDAKENKNAFKINIMNFREHPKYNDPDWIEKMKKLLGLKGWLQEVMCNFVAG